MAAGFETFAQLADVVVMCYRPLKDYAILNDIPLIPLAGAPLITRCLAPWVACGFRRFYILHYDEKVLAAIRANFPKALLGDRPLQLVLVPVPVELSSEKEALRLVAAAREGTNQERDVIVTDCTAILSKEDVIPLVTNFYSSFASASMLLWKPYTAPTADKKDAKKGKGGDKEAEVTGSETLVLAGLEEECAGDVIIGGSSQQPDVAHFRCHYLASAADAVPPLPMGFVARRPNIEFRYDLNDSGVYMLQPWVFDFIISEFDEEEPNNATVRDVLYYIVVAQHAKVNRRPDREEASAKWPIDTLRGLLGKPEDKDALAIKTHWILQGQAAGPAPRTAVPTYYVSDYNAVQHALPSQWDTFRISATVIADKQGSGRRVIRINRATDLALATADIAAGLHYQLVNATMQVAPPRAVCDSLYLTLLASFAEDFHYKRGAAAQSNLKNSIVLCDPKTALGKGTFTDGTFISASATIGNKVSLLNCVVMDGAVVEDGCKLQHCVVKIGAVVEKNTVKSCEAFS